MYKSIVSPLRRRLAVYFYRSRDNQVFVLGHQKSGTTVIAKLIAETLEETYSHDMFYRRGWKDTDRIYSGTLSFQEILSRGKSEFANGVIKDPDLSFFSLELRRTFPNSKSVFVFRNPVDMIASILSRLSIPRSLFLSDLQEVSSVLENKLWRNVFKSYPPNLKATNCIEVLAMRWRYLASKYLSNPELYYPIYYEEFNVNKAESIQNLVVNMGLEPKAEIEHIVDVQYQPKRPEGVRASEFLGDASVSTILRICNVELSLLGYKV